jgi:hypothetical protein
MSANFVQFRVIVFLFQEVIQNAEDAGATRVVFLIDHSTYGTDPCQLYNPHLATFQVSYRQLQQCFRLDYNR